MICRRVAVIVSSSEDDGMVGGTLAGWSQTLPFFHDSGEFLAEFAEGLVLAVAVDGAEHDFDAFYLCSICHFCGYVFGV